MQWYKEYRKFYIDPSLNTIRLNDEEFVDTVGSIISDNRGKHIEITELNNDAVIQAFNTKVIAVISTYESAIYIIGYCDSIRAVIHSLLCFGLDGKLISIGENLDINCNARSIILNEDNDYICKLVPDDSTPGMPLKLLYFIENLKSIIYIPSSKSMAVNINNQDDVYRKIEELKLHWPKFKFQGLKSYCPPLGIKNSFSSLIIYNRSSGILRIFKSECEFGDQLNYYCDMHSMDDIFIIDVDSNGNFTAQTRIDTSVKYTMITLDDDDEQTGIKPNKDATKDIIQSIIDGDTTRVELTSSDFPAELIRHIVTEYFINAKISYDCVAKEYTVVFTLEE